jgi:hypothetical protein
MSFYSCGGDIKGMSKQISNTISFKDDDCVEHVTVGGRECPRLFSRMGNQWETACLACIRPWVASPALSGEGLGRGGKPLKGGVIFTE